MATLDQNKPLELVDHPQTPWPLFDRWFVLAQKSEISNPEAMSLATVGQDGIPQLRTVLLKQIDPDGLVFFTNNQSTKGKNMRYQPEVSVLFYWRSLDRQIRINGAVESVSDQISDAYFATRSRISQIGAWSSQQSQSMVGPEILAKAVAQHQKNFADQTIPRPPHWHGYRIVPKRFEFWIQQSGRLHQRIEYLRDAARVDQWQTNWLFP